MPISSAVAFFPCGPEWFSFLSIAENEPDRPTNAAYSTETLMPQVYDELRRLAAWRMQRMKPGQTLTATAILHEAYLRLNREGEGPRWQDREQFFGAAAEAMRRFLIDRIRAKTRQKRGGGAQHESIDELELAEPAEDDRLLAVNDALDELAKEDPESAELVKMRYFVGLSVEEIAEIRGVSARTIGRNWSYARAWLGRYLEETR